MNAIEVKNLGKRYFQRKDTHRSLKSYVLSRLKKSYMPFETFWALKDVSFEVKKGETLGIIGANGAGKSTLLSLVAKTTEPTEGEVIQNGRIGSLLELGAGFHPDLTGRENVFLNASILGLTKAQTQEKYDEIVNLAGIPAAMETPVKFYSSGMYVRLAFAVAVMSEPDILLMDEVLAVGDESFRQKSMERIERFRTSGKTLLIVSHDLESIKKMSDRVLLLDKGKIVELGDTFDVIDYYRNFTIYNDGDVTVKEFGTGELKIKNIEIKANSEIVESNLSCESDLSIEFEIEVTQEVNNPVFGFSISDNLGNVIFGTNSDLEGVSLGVINSGRKLRIHIPEIPFMRGVFFFSLAAHSQDHTEQYHRMENFKKIKINSATKKEGFLKLEHSFEVVS